MELETRYEPADAAEEDLYDAWSAWAGGGPLLGHLVGLTAVWVYRLFWLSLYFIVWFLAFWICGLLGLAADPRGNGVIWGAAIGLLGWPTWCWVAGQLRKRRVL